MSSAQLGLLAITLVLVLAGAHLMRCGHKHDRERRHGERRVLP